MKKLTSKTQRAAKRPNPELLATLLLENAAAAQVLAVQVTGSLNQRLLLGIAAHLFAAAAHAQGLPNPLPMSRRKVKK